MKRKLFNTLALLGALVPALLLESRAVSSAIKIFTGKYSRNENTASEGKQCENTPDNSLRETVSGEKF